MKPLILQHYRENVIPRLMKKFKYKNVNQVPKIKKIVINVGAGEAVSDPKVLDIIMEDLAIVTGQKPVRTYAKKAISNFRLRRGMPIGCKVTLRGKRMYEFFERFIHFTAPRIRDFRGFPRTSFDGRGSYSFGIEEQLVFPEIEKDKVKMVFGMDITIVTTAKHDDEAMALLEEMGFPFKRS